MPNKTVVITVLFPLILAGAVIRAQAAEPKLITERPNATDSAYTVPRGLFQFEAGISAGELDRSANRRFLTAPESLLRFGLNESFELRLGFDGYFLDEQTPSGGESTTERGFGGASVGFKAVLTEEKGAAPQVAFLGTLNLPTGDETFRSERADPSFRFALSHTLSNRLSLGYNLGMAWVTVTDELGVDNTESLVDWTVTLGFSAGERLGFYLELFGLAGASASTKPLNVFDGGVTYLLTPRFQLDGTVSWGLSEIAPDWTVGVGVGFRFPRFRE